jgi:DedD protein
MASTSTPEATEVRRRGRQRLIGAIALVAVLVVFVPMILDSEPRTKGDQPTLAIPPKDNAAPLPAPPKATPAPAEAAKAADASQPVTVAKTDAKVAEAKVLEPSKPPAPKPAPPEGAVTPAKAGAQSPAAAPKLEGFAVQVGAFRDEAKLEQARQKLNAAKVPHYTERLEAKAGPLTRLRAGPFPTREAAESALASLKRSALDGKVVPLP